MMVKSDSALERTVLANSRCSGVRSVSSSMPVIPITPFIGVRISWLMLARNSDFSLADSRASSRAWASSKVRPRTLVSNCSLVWLSPALAFSRIQG
jgi:hypothetical protein